MNLRAFSYNVDGEVGYILNPVIVEVSGEPELVDEGCLSVPGLWLQDAAATRSPGSAASTSTATRSSSRAPGSWRRRCSTRPTTSTGMLYLDRLEKDERREAMKEVRESDWF